MIFNFFYKKKIKAKQLDYKKAFNIGSTLNAFFFNFFIIEIQYRATKSQLSHIKLATIDSL